MWNDLWKVWRHVSAREAIFLTAAMIVGTTFMIHLSVMMGSDVYINKLLGN